MNSALRWLRASFLVGAVFDGVLGFVFLIPSRMGETQYRYPMGLAASLMFGWTLLMLWGYRRPFERRGVLILTIFPVITGLMAAAAHQYTVGRFSFERVLPSLGLGVALIALFGYSYVRARGSGNSE